MMNYIAKALVLIQVALSLLAMTWAAALCFLATDWGMTKPRLEATERAPSELDKRVAAAKQAFQARDMVVPGVEKAQDKLYGTMARFYKNHLFYRNTLAQLRSGTGPIQVKEIKFENDAPVFDADVAGIDKSYLEYRKELLGKTDKSEDDPEALYHKLMVLNEEVRDLIQKNEKLTRQLNGTDAAGKKVQLGLYDLLEHEAQMQTQIRFEKQYLEPQWASALEQRRSFEERRGGLERTLERLREALGGKEKK
jgi:hypothetical protein